MKKFISLFFVLVLSLSFSACSAESNDENNSSLSIDSENPYEKTTDIAEEMVEVNEKIARGEISQEEGDEMLEELEEEMDDASSEVEEYLGMTHPEEIPAWAEELGLSEPEGLEYIKDDSYVTFEDDNYQINSIDLTYKGDYESAIAQAEKIAEGLGLEEASYSPRKVNEQTQKMMEDLRGMGMSEEEIGTYEELKGATFDNGLFSEAKYSIIVNVDTDGLLTINIVDMEAGMEVLDEYIIDDFDAEDIEEYTN